MPVSSLLDEGGGDVDIFRDDDPRRHVAPIRQLVGAGAQHRAQHRLDALERPAAGQCSVDLRIERAAARARHRRRCREKRPLPPADIARPRPRRRASGFRTRRGFRSSRCRRDPSGKAPARRRAAPRRACWPCGSPLAAARAIIHFPASRRLRRTSASAARAASPPLSCSSGRARAKACASVLTVTMPLPIGSAARDRELHQTARGLLRDDLEVDGVAADHAAKRDHAVIGSAFVLAPHRARWRSRPGFPASRAR